VELPFLTLCSGDLARRVHGSRLIVFDCGALRICDCCVWGDTGTLMEEYDAPADVKSGGAIDDGFSIEWHDFAIVCFDQVIDAAIEIGYYSTSI